MDDLKQEARKKLKRYKATSSLIGLVDNLMGKATLQERRRCADVAYKTGRDFQYNDMPPMKIAEQIGTRIEKGEK